VRIIIWVREEGGSTATQCNKGIEQEVMITFFKGEAGDLQGTVLLRPLACVKDSDGFGSLGAEEEKKERDNEQGRE